MICLLGGERRERGRVEREVDMVLLTRPFCAQSRSTRQAVVPSFALSLTHRHTPTRANTIIHTHIFEFVDIDPITWNRNVLFVLIVLNLVKGQLYKC